MDMEWEDLHDGRRRKKVRGRWGRILRNWYVCQVGLVEGGGGEVMTLPPPVPPFSHVHITSAKFAGGFFTPCQHYKRSRYLP